MMNVRIRQATIEDLESLAALFDEYRVFYESESDLDRARAFLWNRFEHNESVIFIAEAGEEAVAFVQLYPSFSSVSMRRISILNDLFVRETYRGQRIGEGLLNAAKRYDVLTLSL